MSVEIIITVVAIVILAAPCSYTALKLASSPNSIKWHAFSLILTVVLFHLLAFQGSGRLHFQQMFIMGIPTLLVMVFSTSLVWSKYRN